MSGLRDVVAHALAAGYEPDHPDPNEHDYRAADAVIDAIQPQMLAASAMEAVSEALTTVTRVVVIPPNGDAAQWSKGTFAGVELVFQDEGRTLKVFPAGTIAQELS